MSARNIQITLEFDGTEYCGWQIQKSVPTVQGTVTDAARSGLGEPDLSIVGCSRTDSGVHARTYSAHFHSDSTFPLHVIQRILNARLPDDITVLRIAEKEPEFHARYDAIGKTYAYTIDNSPEYHPLNRRYMWHVAQPLSLSSMKKGAGYLVGTHDFTAYCGKTDPGKRTERTVQAVNITRNGRVIRIRVQGKSFLYRMVRIIAGTLTDVGRGKIPPEEVKLILESKDKNKMREAAPACGLCLEAVEY